MNILFFVLGCLCLNTIHFNILVEKDLKNFDEKFTLETINLVMEQYNSHLINIGLRFRLDSILDYKKYSNATAFRDFALLAGEDNLEKRKGALKGIHSNLLVIYSSLEPKLFGHHNTINTCKDRYFVNMVTMESKEDEIIRVSIETIKGYMRSLLGVNIPEFYELNELVLRQDSGTDSVWSSVDPDVLNEIKRCAPDFRSTIRTPSPGQYQKLHRQVPIRNLSTDYSPVKIKNSLPEKMKPLSLGYAQLNKYEMKILRKPRQSSTESEQIISKTRIEESSSISFLFDSTDRSHKHSEV